jgi:hypothetical protein
LCNVALSGFKAKNSLQNPSVLSTSFSSSSYKIVSLETLALSITRSSHLEQSFVELDYFLLKDLRPSLLSER